MKSKGRTDQNLNPEAFLKEVPLDQLWDAAPDSLILVDESGEIVAMNRAAETMFGFEAGALLGSPVERLVPEAYRQIHRGHRNGFVGTDARRAMAAGIGLQALRADGSVFPAQISLSSFRIGDSVLTMAAVRNVSEWIAAEELLEDARKHRELAEDRERIARDLHDTVIQELFGIGMGLQSVQSEAGSEIVRQRISDSVDEIDSTIRQVRTAIFGLQNDAHSAAGLGASVVELAAGLEPSLGFRPHVQISGPLDTAVPDRVGEHVLPTVREALTNVAKHADATSARVEIDVSDQLTVLVTDDGVGLPADNEPSGGLLNLGRRAALLGGRFEIACADSGGTELVWTVPLTE
jgi:PAS domain S-box-containing protein